MKIRVVSQIWFKEHGWNDTPTPLYQHPERNELDDEYFRRLNPQIQSNPLVRRLLSNALFWDGCW